MRWLDVAIVPVYILVVQTRVLVITQLTLIAPTVLAHIQDAPTLKHATTMQIQAAIMVHAYLLLQLATTTIQTL